VEEVVVGAVTHKRKEKIHSLSRSYKDIEEHHLWIYTKGLQSKQMQQRYFSLYILLGAKDMSAHCFFFYY